MRQLLLFIAIVLCFSACRDKVICPAFQSTYILDDSVRSIYYSYLWKLNEEERLTYLAQNQPQVDTSSMANDTTAIGGPVLASASGQVDYWAYVAQYKVPERDVNKNKYGIVKYEPYWLKNYRQRTAPMENVLTPPEPPILPADTVKDFGEFVASDFNDSLATDSMSLAVQLDVQPDSTSLAEEDTFSIPSFPPIAKMAEKKEKPETRFLYRYDPKDEMLNVEQQYYNKYFGDQLYVKLVKNPAPLDTASEASGGGFFKNLFRKKPKVEADSLSTEQPLIEEPLIEENPEKEEEEEDGF
ncbi:MAG: hypothetical protein CMP48_10420 [Rickettsiales bacterium]|nr:hypothetical protein [Rickettsiales bacterium]